MALRLGWRLGLRYGLLFAALFLGASVVLLVSTILYGTRTEVYSLPPLVKEVMPAGHCHCTYSTTFVCDSCLDCAALGNTTAAATPSQRGDDDTETANNNANDANDAEDWAFSFRRDAHDYGLDEDRCHAAFPGLFEDINRALAYRRSQGKVTEIELSGIRLTKGMTHAMVHNGELYVLRTHYVDHVNREKAIASLAALHRALTTAPHRQALPNVEFVLNVEDLPDQRNLPIWSLARRAQDEAWWLVPDFGFWAWDMPSLGTFGEVLDEAVAREAIEPWDSKQEKLVWRGKITYAPKLRHALVDASAGKRWSDVGPLNWATPDGKGDQSHSFKSAVDQCNYKYIAHVEGRSYSGALKYRQLCRSVIVMHKLQWIQHYHYLLRANGTYQNYVEVERDWSDLDDAMEDLLAHPEKARRIADNSVAVFRERYLTPAAEACYWRALLKAWKEVSFEPLLYKSVRVDGAVKMTEKRGVRFETFMIYENARQMDYPSSA